MQEARRINTPPTSPDTPSARGFFFDMAAPRHDTDSDSHSPGTPGITKDSPSLEWWEADTRHHQTNKSAHSSKEKKLLKAQGPAISQFELNTPEHFPSSPLCPKHPKHASGGSGVCVYHGRRRSVKLKNLKRADTESTDKGGEMECLK